MKGAHSEDGLDRPADATAQNLIDSGLYDVVFKLLSARDLFDEHPVRDICSMHIYLSLTYGIPQKRYIDTVLCIIREITDIATSEVRRSKDYDGTGSDIAPQRVSVDSRVAQIISCLFELAWDHRAIFDDSHWNTAVMRRSPENSRICMWEIFYYTQWS